MRSYRLLVLTPLSPPITLTTAATILAALRSPLTQPYGLYSVHTQSYGLNGLAASSGSGPGPPPPPPAPPDTPPHAAPLLLVHPAHRGPVDREEAVRLAESLTGEGGGGCPALRVRGKRYGWRRPSRIRAGCIVLQGLVVRRVHEGLCGWL